MIYKPFQSISLSRLGMGNMRLPSTDPKDPNAPIDHPEAHRVISRAYEHGINYFDTAYVYNKGDSEVCLGEVMPRFPRESYYLATKFNYRSNPDYKAVFEEQLRRLNTDRIDFYLLHCLLAGNIESYLSCGCIDYFLEQKEKGRISYLGFSNHAEPEVLERFADHHAWDFAQLELNYYDWIYGTAEKEYGILAERNIPIMVMEPVRGGLLADLTPETNAILKKAHPDWSIASWAFRFLKGLPGIQVILSGMSDLAQVEDNAATFSKEDALSEEDRKLLFEVCERFHAQVTVPCTGCRYCTEGCPAKINIPEFLKLYNDYRVDGPFVLGRIDKVESEGRPGDCVGCGACTASCPQGIDTPTFLRELAEKTAK